MLYKVGGQRNQTERTPEEDRVDYVKNDMESLGLSEKDAQSTNKWKSRIKGGNRLT